jgi:hypothetical protein
LNASLSSLKIENEKLIAKAKDLNVCSASISNLRDENAILHANCWGPSAYEGPQKQDLTVFLEYNV